MERFTTQNTIQNLKYKNAAMAVIMLTVWLHAEDGVQVLR